MRASKPILPPDNDGQIPRAPWLQLCHQRCPVPIPVRELHFEVTDAMTSAIRMLRAQLSRP
jgi:hypothetical protein